LWQKSTGYTGRLSSSVAVCETHFARAPDKQEPNLSKRSHAYWVHVAFADSLVRLRLLIEQNFAHIESIGLLAVTRYVFELTVWLKLLAKDSRYGLVYYRELIKNQLEYHTDLRNHLIREVTFLLEAQEREKKLIAERLEEVKGRC